METLAQVLKRRDQLDDAEIHELINDARLRVWAGDDPEEVLADEFGLEPDYVFDLLVEPEDLESLVEKEDCPNDWKRCTCDQCSTARADAADAGDSYNEDEAWARKHPSERS